MDTLVTLLRALSTGEIETPAHEFAGDRFTKAIEERSNMWALAVSAKLDTLPAANPWRIEHLYEQLVAHVHSGRSLIQSIYVTRREIAELELRIKTHVHESAMALGSATEAATKRKNALTVSAAIFGSAATNAESSYNAYGAAGADVSGGLESAVKASRVLAGITNNHPDNPPRFDAADYLQRLSSQTSIHSLSGAAFASMGSQHSSLAAQTTSSGEVAALDHLLQGLTDSATYHNECAARLTTFRDEATLEAELSEQVLHYATIARQTKPLVAVFSEAMDNLYTETLPELCALWSNAKVEDFAVPGVMENCLALLTVTDNAIRQVEGTLSLCSATFAVDLTKDAATDEYLGPLTVNPLPVARLRGLSFVAQVPPEVCFSLHMTFDGFTNVEVSAPMVGSRSDAGTAAIYGANELWNRPIFAQASIRASAFGGTIPDAKVRLVVVIHYLG